MGYVEDKVCKHCGGSVRGENIYCNQCRWKAKWAEHVLNSPELASRRKRSHLTKIVSIDYDKPEAIFIATAKDSKSLTYTTTLGDCTCKDFALHHGKRPCKHILRLAEELGLFNSECFAPGEHDYTMPPKKTEKADKVDSPEWWEL